MIFPMFFNDAIFFFLSLLTFVMFCLGMTYFISFCFLSYFENVYSTNKRVVMKSLIKWEKKLIFWGAKAYVTAALAALGAFFINYFAVLLM